MARRFEVNGASGLLRAGPIALMAVATVIFTFVLYDSRQRFVSLQAPAFATGWWLFATVMTLVLFNLRKKLPMVPAGRASGLVFWRVRLLNTTHRTDCQYPQGDKLYKIM